MSCSCVSGERAFDFTITTLDTCSLQYMDKSCWVKDEPYVTPSSYILDITLPERKQPVRKEISLNQIITLEDLETNRFYDGIYEFSLIDCNTSNPSYLGCCGIIYKKKKLIYPNLQCCLDQAFATLDYNEVKEVESFFKQAENAIELDKCKLGKELFDIASQKLDDLKCDCGC